jgi:hypothetical protein
MPVCSPLTKSSPLAGTFVSALHAYVELLGINSYGQSGIAKALKNHRTSIVPQVIHADIVFSMLTLLTTNTNRRRRLSPGNSASVRNQL